MLVVKHFVGELGSDWIKHFLCQAGLVRGSEMDRAMDKFTLLCPLLMSSWMAVWSKVKLFRRDLMSTWRPPAHYHHVSAHDVRWNVKPYQDVVKIGKLAEGHRHESPICGEQQVKHENSLPRLYLSCSSFRWPWLITDVFRVLKLHRAHFTMSILIVPRIFIHTSRSVVFGWCIWVVHEDRFSNSKKVCNLEVRRCCQSPKHRFTCFKPKRSLFHSYFNPTDDGFLYCQISLLFTYLYSHHVPCFNSWLSKLHVQLSTSCTYA